MSSRPKRLSFLLTVTLRFQHSWMRWRQRRRLRRLATAERRLELLIQLGAEQRLLVQHLERQAHPLLEVTLPEPEPETYRYPQPVTVPELEILDLEPEPPLVTPESLEPEPEPMESAQDQIFRALGLPPRQTTPHDSSS